MKIRKKPISYDTETTGLKRWGRDYMFTYSTCDWNGKTDVQRFDDGPEARKRLEWIWSDENKDLPKIMHNARFDIGMTEKFLGRSLRGHEIHETMALGHILFNKHPGHGLDNLAFDFFGYTKDQDKVLEPYLASEFAYRDVPAEVLDPYQRADAERTMLLYQGFRPKVHEGGYDEIYGMEQQLVWTTNDICRRGVMLDERKAKKLINWCHVESEKALTDFRAITGIPNSNPNKALELGRILFEDMGFPIRKRTKKGKPSTVKSILRALYEETKHPIFEAIMKYRSYSKGVAMIQGYIEGADDDWMLHPNINPYGADTGRESCSNPNLQNVAKAGALLNPFPVPARRCFRPRPGYVNFHLDYKGLQAGIFTGRSQDVEFMKILRAGGDMHDAAAIEFLGDRYINELDTIIKKMLRDASKNGNFCVAFGGGMPQLAKTLGLTPEEMEPGYRRYKNRFRGLVELNRKDMAFVREHGYVLTSFGRKLSLSRSKPYMGTVYAVQGDEAGIAKRAQNRVNAYLMEVTSDEAGIILPVHDEIIIEWPRKRLKDAPEILRKVCELMTDFPQINVPLSVDIQKTTTDWAHKKNYAILA